MIDEIAKLQTQLKEMQSSMESLKSGLHLIRDGLQESSLCNIREQPTERQPSIEVVSKAEGITIL